ncbi:hypothetical protein EC957_009860 [Mortierella hygrophila]|uniref:Crinkler effector protein N-terminal domain-containing protein n=1 Tax=Mortierella hygrophila TaxID=979708 RepID=A0A9P6EW84_9FUNG|nr:hypothetical protein EC957_009860 [Mortierella hygrophila]
MATSTLTLFCLISGESTASAFSVKVDRSATVDDLKDAIKSKQAPAFDDITANNLVLWRATISADEEGIITLDSLDDKTKLGNPRTHLSKLFPKTPDDNTYIVVERPKATSTPHTLELEAKMEELLMELEDLRGGKSIVVLNVVVRPNRSECFSWTTDTETTSIKELERAIYDEYPDREDGEAVLAIIHARGTPQHEGGGTEHPSNDTRFRNIIRQYSKTNTRTLTVALETPTKKYSDFTLKEVNSLYEISNMETPTMSDLPPFTGISTEPLDSDLHKESLRRLLDELDSRIRAIPSDTANEAICSAYVCSFLTQAILIFNGELTLAPERPLRGRHGHGKVDYAIEALAKDGSRHILGVTEVKHEDYRKGLAQNLVQLESSLTVRKRKRSSDDNGDEEREEDSSVPLRAYGIVTDTINWYFVECTIDQSQESGDRPKFRISKLKDIINYDKDTWRVEAESVLGQIVWLMRKMYSEIPGRELQLKKQKFTTSGESSPPTGKMQRV